MEENKEMNEKPVTEAENPSEYRCQAAKSLHRCGQVIMIIGFMLAFFFFALIIAEFNGDQYRALKYFLGLMASFFGGYIILCVLKGLAVIVEAQYRKSIEKG